jgi:hypothetical protein
VLPIEAEPINETLLNTLAAHGLLNVGCPRYWMNVRLASLMPPGLLQLNPLDVTVVAEMGYEGGRYPDRINRLGERPDDPRHPVGLRDRPAERHPRRSRTGDPRQYPADARCSVPQAGDLPDGRDAAGPGTAAAADPDHSTGQHVGHLFGSSDVAKLRPV